MSGFQVKLIESKSKKDLESIAGSKAAFRKEIKDATNLAQLKKAVVRGFKILGIFDRNEDEN